LRAIHAHVQRSVSAVAEAPIGVVELVRADPQVEERTRKPFMSELPHDRGDVVEAGPANRRPVAEPAQCCRCCCYRRLVTIEADELDVRVGLQQRLRMAGAAHRGVDHQPPGNRPEELDHLVHHHGLVAERGGGHSAVPLIRNPPTGGRRRDVSPIDLGWKRAE